MNTYAEKKKAAMQPKQARAAAKVSDERLRSRLSALHSRPTALSEELGSKIRERCGIDPGAVKVFRDDGLRELGQTAYAKGAEIHLASGVSTTGEAGERVILHEAAHLAQQGSHGVSGMINDSPALEQQADRVAAGEVMQGSFSLPVNSETAPIQGWAPWDKAKKKMASGKAWLKNKAEKAKAWDQEKTAAFAEGTSLGNKHLDRLVAAHDWVRDRADDLHDFNKGVKKKIADKYHGSMLESGINGAKDWLVGAKNWTADKAKSAGEKIKGSKLGQWVSRKKEERAKKKAEEALHPKEPGKISKFMTGAKNWVSEKATSAGNAIKESKVGQLAKSAGNWVKDKSVRTGNWVKDKAVRAGKWASETKDNISDWVEDKKQAYADHEDQRYLKRIVRKGGAGVLNNIALADQELKHGEYSGNVKHRAEELKDYDEEKRRYMTDEEASAAAAAKEAEPMSMGKVADFLGDNIDLVGSVTSAHAARKRGNGQQAALDSMDAMNSVMGYATKAMKNMNLPGLSAAGDVVEMGTTIGKLGINGYQKYKLHGIDEAAQTQGVDEADQKYMRIANKGYNSQLNDDLRSGAGNVLKYGVSALGSGLDTVTGGVTSKVANVLNKGIDLGVDHFNSADRAKTDRHIGYEDLFGSMEAAKSFKHKHGLDKTTMEILMKRNTGSRSTGDLANRSRYEAARVNHQYLAKSGDNGAKKMMAAFGEKNFGQTPLDMIEDKMGQTQNLEELNRRRRAIT